MLDAVSSSTPFFLRLSTNLSTFFGSDNLDISPSKIN